MQDFVYEEYVKMIKEHQDNDEPTSWSDSIYKDAKGDYSKVFWAVLILCFLN